MKRLVDCMLPLTWSSVGRKHQLLMSLVDKMGAFVLFEKEIWHWSSEGVERM